MKTTQKLRQSQNDENLKNEDDPWKEENIKYGNNRKNKDNPKN